MRYVPIVNSILLVLNFKRVSIFSVNSFKTTQKLKTILSIVVFKRDTKKNYQKKKKQC